jgi:hypothetical protein
MVVVAVGTALADRPPPRPVLDGLPHTVPTWGQRGGSEAAPGPGPPIQREGSAQSPVHGQRSRRSLAHRPSLQNLRCPARQAGPRGVGGGLPASPFRLRGGVPVPPCLLASLPPAWFGPFTGTMPVFGFPGAYMSGVRSQTFPDRPRTWGTPGISRFSCLELPRMHRVFDSVGPGRRSRLARRPVGPSQHLSAVGAPGHSEIPELNGWPARTPVHASPAASPPQTQDAGPWWLATPSMSDSLIPCSMPVHPGASPVVILHLCALVRWQQPAVMPPFPRLPAAYSRSCPAS